MHKLGPLCKTALGNQHVVILTHGYSKVTRAAATWRMAYTHLATIFLDIWISPYGMPNYDLTDNGPGFISKLFTTLCRFLMVEKLISTTNNLQTNGQLERYSCTLVATLRHYISEREENWHRHVLPLTYPYNLQTDKRQQHPFSRDITSLTTICSYIWRQTSSANDIQRDLTWWNLIYWHLQRIALMEASV